MIEVSGLKDLNAAELFLGFRIGAHFNSQIIDYKEDLSEKMGRQATETGV